MSDISMNALVPTSAPACDLLPDPVRPQITREDMRDRVNHVAVDALFSGHLIVYRLLASITEAMDECRAIELLANIEAWEARGRGWV